MSRKLVLTGMIATLIIAVAMGAYFFTPQTQPTPQQITPERPEQPEEPEDNATAIDLFGPPLVPDEPIPVEYTQVFLLNITAPTSVVPGVPFTIDFAFNNTGNISYTIGIFFNLTFGQPLNMTGDELMQYVQLVNIYNANTTQGVSYLLRVDNDTVQCQIPGNGAIIIEPGVVIVSLEFVITSIPPTIDPTKLTTIYYQYGAAYLPP